MTTAIRAPAVAGRFYPADPNELEREVRRCLGEAEPEQAVSVVVAPHAGYMYSGRIAGETYARARVPSRAVVLCPNHTGRGPRRSVTAASAWDLPGGSVTIDADLRDRIARELELSLDDSAHSREHSAEVQLPFLRAKNPEVAVAVVCFGVLPRDECVLLGQKLAGVIRESTAGTTSDILVVASTDMSHYIPASVAKSLDMLAIGRVLALDPEGLYEVVVERDISMCGFVPTTVAISAARALGARSARLVRYGNSGETSGDMESVVGYAGALIS